MGLFNGMKRVMKPLTDVRTWSDWGRFKDYGGNVISDIKILIVPAKSEAKESFAQAKKRLQLSEDDLERLKDKYFLVSLIFLFLAIIAAGYFVYLVRFQGVGQILNIYHVSLLGCVVVILALTQAFRFHFWYFQISVEKLGCDFSEWFKHGLLRKKM